MGALTKRSGDSLPGIEKRIVAIMVVLTVLYLALSVYFWRLQVLQHARYQRLADNNRIRLVEMPATRGIITDRNGVIIADSGPEYSLAFIPEDMFSDREKEVASVARLLDRDSLTATEKFLKNATDAPYRPVEVFEHLEEEEVALFEAVQDRFPGSIILVVPRRFYPFGETAAHLLGYVGEISREELDAGAYPEARKRDTVGKYGIERAYDEFLRGRDGGRQVEVDARGREINILGVTEPVPGANLKLTLDIRLQTALEDELRDKRGAGVLMDVETGEVLAIVSRPAFDPNEFSMRLSTDRWNEILWDPGHPMQSRAMQGLYPPGSTFKVVTAVASLMEHTLEPDERLFCSGGYYYGRRIYRDWKPGGHGSVDLHKGIVESCDVYFYQAGERVGIDALAHWASVLGLGSKTGIDVPGEAEGLVPSPEWKMKARGEVWYPGETLSAAIGQGYVLVTPLQLVSLYGTIARRGVPMDPYLVTRIEDVDGTEMYRRDPVDRGDPVVPGEILEAIIRALEGVVSEEQGTGRVARGAGMPVAGKTGTAQVVRLQDMQDRDLEEIPYELRDHGWFAAFAPVDKPRVVSAVIVEHGGHGSSSAAPIVTRMIRKYGELYPTETSEPSPERPEL